VITGAVPELGYLWTGRPCPYARSPFQLGGPFGFCAFALLTPCGHSRPRLLGSLEIALKRTRPRQRFCLYSWAVFYDGGRRMSRGNSFKFISIILIIQHRPIGIYRPILTVAVAENAGKEQMNAQLVTVTDGHGNFKISRLIREIPYCSCNDFPIPYFE
jgi:hypothetical protein